MQRRNAFSMIELIITIVIMGILASGTYVALTKLYTKSSKSKAIAELSLESMRISEQIAKLLRHRIPSTVIGYDPGSDAFRSIYTLTSSYPVLEWIGSDFESYNAGMYSGFADLDRCDPNTQLIYSPKTDINATDRALIFAGAFDEGEISYDEGEFNSSFGWHNNAHTKIFDLNQSTSTNQNIYLSLAQKPEIIYEKYTLTRGAFAIARYEDIDTNAPCIQNLPITLNTNSLLLFYDYKPWGNERFCADPNGTHQSGKVTLLSNEADGFEIDFVNGNLQFNLSLSRTIKKPGKDLVVTISKEKVVF